MNKKILSIILKAPAILLLLVSLGVTIYLTIVDTDFENMTWLTPLIFFIILFLYFLGSYLGRVNTDKT
jgi:hypothetical protein